MADQPPNLANIAAAAIVRQAENDAAKIKQQLEVQRRREKEDRERALIAEARRRASESGQR